MQHGPCACLRHALLIAQPAALVWLSDVLILVLYSTRLTIHQIDEHRARGQAKAKAILYFEHYANRASASQTSIQARG